MNKNKLLQKENKFLQKENKDLAIKVIVLEDILNNEISKKEINFECTLEDAIKRIYEVIK